MTAKILKHKFQSAIVDGTDATLVRPSNWNDDHDIWQGYRTVSGTTDTLAHTDNFSLITYTNVAAIAVSLAAPSGGNFPLGWNAMLRNLSSTSSVTITGTGGATINSAATYVIAPFEAVILVSTGAADYRAVPIPARGLFVATTTIAAGTSGRFLYDNAGVLGEAVALRPDVTATITVGYTFTPFNAATWNSGTFTPNPANGNYQYLACAGAFTLAAPTVDCAIDILVTNGGAGGGTITFSGFTVSANVGDPITTAANQKFIISIRRINAIATYTTKALQ
jgi:hypothetical protein